MNQTLNNILLPILITVVPFYIPYYQDRSSTYTKAIIWGVISFVLSYLLFEILKLDINILVMGSTIFLSTIFNLFIVDGKIDVKKVPKSLIFVGLFFFSSLFQLIPISILNWNINQLTDSQNAYLTLFSDFILIILFIIFYRKDLKEDFIKLKKNFYSIMDTSFKYWLIGLVVMVLSNLLITFLLPNAVAENEQQVQNIIQAAPLISFFCVGIFAPIIEELTFRKTFFDVFKNKWLFIFLSGFIFGGLHVFLTMNHWQDLLYLIPYCSLGFAFAAIYVKTDNLYASITVHAFHNICLTLISIVSSLSLVILW